MSLKPGEPFRIEQRRVIRRASDLKKLPDLCVQCAYMFDGAGIAERYLDRLPVYPGELFPDPLHALFHFFDIALPDEEQDVLIDRRLHEDVFPAIEF